MSANEREACESSVAAAVAGPRALSHTHNRFTKNGVIISQKQGKN